METSTSKAEQVISEISSVTAVATPIVGVVGTALGQPEIALIAGLLQKFGPTIALTVARWFERKTVTTTEVIAAFEPLKAYADYGIPDKVP